MEDQTINEQTNILPESSLWEAIPDETAATYTGAVLSGSLDMVFPLLIKAVVNTMMDYFTTGVMANFFGSLVDNLFGIGNSERDRAPTPPVE
ncbi:hypothetical protein H6F74_08895 [Trichocoleus sp. FACHB-90]|uniref:hypothetical protein n=1 Tax=Cyanophyceae TaxID=3028117 RepID=UPI0016823B10|nr:hypothetical protein [Trichocoleus sp. FACHB-90]MBD1926364.1 hypothetical protein [Trichocoleus sp. FACHB-90]